MTPVDALPLQRTRPTAAVTGPPVLLIHGFASGPGDWPSQRWAEPLAAAGRETLVVHLPGHGDSSGIASADEVTTARVLARLTETVRLSAGGEVDIIGYSLGARLAWDLAAGAPVRRLVLGGLSPVEPFGAVDLVAARAFARTGRQPADPLTAAIAGMASAPGRDTDSLLFLVEGLAREPFDPAVRPPATQTLFVGGNADPMVQGLDKVAALVPGAPVTMVPGDHLQALQSEEFRAAAFGFLGVTR